MFIFTKTIKETLVSVGVVISCGLFVAYAIWCITLGVWGLLALSLLLPVLAVLKGNKLGYLVTRYIWTGVVFFVLSGCLLNPFAWKDSLLGGFGMIGASLLIFLSAFCLSYSLSEHAKLRKIEGAQTWRSLPLPLKWVLILLGAGAMGFGGLWLSVSVSTPRVTKMRTAADLLTLRAQLGDFQSRNGDYPATESGLQAIKWQHKDAWGNDYVYRFPGKRDSRGYDLFSAGPDHTADTADDDWGLP